MNPRDFLAELKRRNVYKVAVAYAVFAWLLIQPGSILFPTFEAPPHGMKRTEDISPHEVLPYWSKRKYAALIVSAAIAASELALHAQSEKLPDWAVTR